MVITKEMSKEVKERDKRTKGRIKELQKQLGGIKTLILADDEIGSDWEYRKQEDLRGKEGELKDRIKDERRYLHKHSWSELPEMIKFTPITIMRCLGCGMQFARGWRGVKISKEEVREVEKDEMLIRRNVEEEDNPQEEGKYFVCYAVDGSPVSPDTDYRYFPTLQAARNYIEEEGGILVFENEGSKKILCCETNRD